MTNLFYLDDYQEDQDLADDEIDTDEATEDTTESVSIEEFKKFQANKEKGVQKLITKQKAMDYAVDNLSEVAENPEHLLTVYEKNKQSGEYILKKYYDGMDINQFKKDILKQKTVEGEKKELSEDSIRQQVEREYEQREINKFLKEFKKNISHHDEDVQEQIMREYEDYIEGKSNLDAEKVKKYAYKSYQDILGVKFDDTRVVASMMGVGANKSSGSSKKSDVEEATNEFKSIMRSKLGRSFKN